MKYLLKYLIILFLFLQYNPRSFNQTLRLEPLQRPAKPAWLSDPSISPESQDKSKTSIWKPIAVTAAAAGLTYALYSVRSSS